MSETTPAAFGDNKDTWRTATLVTGFALLISMAAHVGGPSSAAAGPDQHYNPQLNHSPAQQSLSIGGFAMVDDQPAFIVLNEEGQRIGSLPMQAADQHESLND
jgi:hypothetical protein